MKPTQFCNNIDDAIRIGDDFYWDIPYCNEGKSGGTKCPSCRKWTKFPRKYKYKQPTWIYGCDGCKKDKELVKEMSDMDKFTQVLNELCEKISSVENKMVKLLGKFPENLVEIQGKIDLPPIDVTSLSFGTEEKLPSNILELRNMCFGIKK